MKYRSSIRRGCYVLCSYLSKPQSILVGSLGYISFYQGWYAYVGSALGGFNSRLDRHVRKNKVPKWHIDYLLQKADLENIIVCETEERVECEIAKALNEKYKVVPGFGSSDCRCRGHLLFGKEEMETWILKALTSLELKPVIYQGREKTGV